MASVVVRGVGLVRCPPDEAELVFTVDAIELEPDAALNRNVTFDLLT